MDFTKLMQFDNPTQAYPAYAKMARAEGNEPMGFTNLFIPWWEGLKGLTRGSTTKSARRYVPVKDALEASVAIVNETTHKEDAKMAATTTRSRKSNTRSSAMPSRRGPLKSAYLHDDPDVAFAAYKKMPHTKSPNARVLTKREFMKVYPQKHAEAVRKEQAKNAQAQEAEQTTTNGQSIVDVLGDGWQDADQGVIDALVNAGYTLPENGKQDEPTDAPDAEIIKALAHNAEALNAYLSQFEGTLVSEVSTAKRSTSKRYRARTDRSDLPGGGDTYGADEDIAPASNAVLWALNTEGLLMTAYEAAEENGDVLGTDNASDVPYITQAIGKATLTNVFGPQPERQTA